MVLKHGVHRDAIYHQNPSSAMMRPHDREKTDSMGVAALQDNFNAEDITTKQQILSQTIKICDEEKVSRPTYIIEELRW